MKISIVGAGNVGSTLGLGWYKTGHQIHYGVPNPADDKYMALKDYAVVSNSEEAVQLSDIVVLATPWVKTLDIVKELSHLLDNKILVDCTNPLEPDLSGLTVGHSTSGAELIADLLPQTRVVKAFNSTGFNIMAKPSINDLQTLMLVASDDSNARQIVCQLSADLGFDTHEFGDITSARLLEPFALLWISLAYRYGLGRDFGLAVLRDLHN